MVSAVKQPDEDPRMTFKPVSVRIYLLHSICSSGLLLTVHNFFFPQSSIGMNQPQIFLSDNLVAGNNFNLQSS
jgi:hypothetical protein